MIDRKAQIAAPLSLYVRHDQWTELRVLFPHGKTAHDFYRGDQLHAMAERALQYEAGGAKGIYFTPNALVENISHPAKDADVVRRDWLLIDVDPVRAHGHEKESATDEEKAAARTVADRLMQSLQAYGFAGPIVADSGNGCHVTYPIDAPNDEDARQQVQSLLRHLGTTFSTDRAKVDLAVFNAARIWKVPGTLSRKGSGEGDRPHRVARILEAPTPKELDVARSKNWQALLAPGQPV